MLRRLLLRLRLRSKRRWRPSRRFGLRRVGMPARRICFGPKSAMPAPAPSQKLASKPSRMHSAPRNSAWPMLRAPQRRLNRLRLLRHRPLLHRQHRLLLRRLLPHQRRLRVRPLPRPRRAPRRQLRPHLLPRVRLRLLRRRARMGMIARVPRSVRARPATIRVLRRAKAVARSRSSCRVLRVDRLLPIAAEHPESRRSSSEKTMLARVPLLSRRPTTKRAAPSSVAASSSACP